MMPRYHTTPSIKLFRKGAGLRYFFSYTILPADLIVLSLCYDKPAEDHSFVELYFPWETPHGMLEKNAEECLVRRGL